MTEHAREMKELTARFHQRDLDRTAYLEELVTAVDGDLTATWQEAEAALRSTAPPEESDQPDEGSG
jgi:hypothetical protein